jgi:proteic killer suppression protein
MSIRSFKCADTEALFQGKRIRRFVNFESTAMRKLAMLNRAERLDDLRVPPGNRLESLRGKRAGQFSIRINDQFRICFVWEPQGPKDVEIVDYH